MTLLVDFVPGIHCDTGFGCMAGQPFSLAFHRYADWQGTLGSGMGNFIFESCAASGESCHYRESKNWPYYGLSREPVKMIELIL